MGETARFGLLYPLIAEAKPKRLSSLESLSKSKSKSQLKQMLMPKSGSSTNCKLTFDSTTRPMSKAGRTERKDTTLAFSREKKNQKGSRMYEPMRVCKSCYWLYTLFESKMQKLKNPMPRSELTVQSSSLEQNSCSSCAKNRSAGGIKPIARPWCWLATPKRSLATRSRRPKNSPLCPKLR